MNILELEFEQKLKEQVNEKVDYLQTAIIDELAGIDLMLFNANVNDDIINGIIEKFNKINSYLNNAKIKEVK